MSRKQDINHIICTKLRVNSFLKGFLLYHLQHYMECGRDETRKENETICKTKTNNPQC